MRIVSLDDTLIGLAPTDYADQHSLRDVSSLEMEFTPMLTPDAATKRLLFRDGKTLFSLARIDWEFESPTVRALAAARSCSDSFCSLVTLMWFFRFSMFALIFCCLLVRGLIASCSKVAFCLRLTIPAGWNCGDLIFSFPLSPESTSPKSSRGEGEPKLAETKSSTLRPPTRTASIDRQSGDGAGEAS